MARVAAKAGALFGKLVSRVQQAWRTGHQAAARAAAQFMAGYRQELASMQALETARARELARDKEMKKLMKQERRLLEGGIFSRGAEAGAYRELWDQFMAMSYSIRGRQAQFKRYEVRTLRDTLKEEKRLLRLKSVLLRKLAIMREEFASTMAILRCVEMMEAETRRELPAEQRERGVAARGI